MPAGSQKCIKTLVEIFSILIIFKEKNLQHSAIWRVFPGDSGQRVGVRVPTTRRILGFVLLLATGPTWAGPVQIQAVRLASQAETTRVTLELSQSSEHKLFTLSNPHRVVVDIKPGRIVKQALPLPKGHGSVQRIRTANRQDGSVRVVLDLAAPVQPKSFLLNPDGQRGNRLVIDLRSVGVTASVKAAPVKKAPLASRGAGRDIVIAIDPGHGGKDPGARGRNGAREKDVVLKISRQLAGKIDAEPGMRAIMTRHGDTFVHLRDRGHSFAVGCIPTRQLVSFQVAT